MPARAETRSEAPAERLAALMREHHMTQRDLCRLWNLSPAYVSDICGGRRKFSALVAVRLEVTFGEPPAEWWMDQERDRELRRARLLLFGDSPAPPPSLAGRPGGT